MFKNVFVFVLFFLISFGESNELFNSYEKELKSINEEQAKTIKEIIKRTKEFDLVWSALAISWQESGFGKWKINLQDPSCGPFHQSIDTYFKRYSVKDTSFNRNKVCSELVSNYDLSVSTFVAEVEFWLLVHKNKQNKWDYVYRSYNAGYNYNSEKAKEYSKKIRTRISVLKKYLDKII